MAPTARHFDEPGWGSGSLSPQALERLARPPVAPLRPPSATDLEAVRRWRSEIHRGWLAGDPSPEACGHSRQHVAGIPVLRAGVGEGRPLIVYFHGGGYALGSTAVAAPITERLALGCEVVSVDYRLAPEDPYPAAISDAEAVVAAVLAAVDGDRAVVVAGDSAGANLALSVAQRRGAAGHRDLDGLVLLSPHLDHDPESVSTPGPGQDVDDEAARWLRRAYCGEHSPTDSGLSPIGGSFVDLPATLIQAGGVDSALPTSIKAARRARRAGVAVDLDIWSGLWHTWHYHRDLPEADHALTEVVNFCRRQARGPHRG